MLHAVIMLGPAAFWNKSASRKAWMFAITHSFFSFDWGSNKHFLKLFFSPYLIRYPDTSCDCRQTNGWMTWLRHPERLVSNKVESLVEAGAKGLIRSFSFIVQPQDRQAWRINDIMRWPESQRSKQTEGLKEYAYTALRNIVKMFKSNIKEK